MALAVAGCSKGLDRKLDRTSDESFNKSLEAMLAEATPQEKEIVAEHYRPMVFATLGAALHGNDPGFGGETGRELFSSYIEGKIKDQESLISQLNDRKKNTSVLNGLRLDEPVYIKESQEFFTRGEPEVRLTVTNGTQLRISQMRVHTRLYVDGGNTAEAESNNVIIFSNGLEPGQTLTASYAPGGPFGDNGGWNKLSVKKSTTQRLEVGLLSVKDYQENEIKKVSAVEIGAAESEKIRLKEQLEILANKK